MRTALALLFASSLPLASLALADAQSNPWARFKSAAPGKAESIGGYSAGCVVGAEALPARGPGYRVVHPGRRRAFGHPRLVSFVRELARDMKRRGLGTLLVGDLGQVRGGPAPSGHASHQSGLDVDLWYWAASDDELASERKQKSGLSARCVVDAAEKRVNEHWSERTQAMVRLAASDARVARVFVNPVVKQALCEAEKSERAYLAKVRPWYGHDEHFHVRLACPDDSPACESQPQVPAGDGCAELTEWLAPDAEQAKKQDRERYRARVGALPELPAACQALISLP